MSQILLVRSVLEEGEFNHLWDLKSSKNNIDGTNPSWLASITMGGSDSVGTTLARQERLVAEADAAFQIIRHIFGSSKADFDRASIIPSQDAFRHIASAFNNVAKHQSGLLVPIAKLMAKVAAHPGNVDPDSLTQSFVRHVFMDPHNVVELNGNTYDIPIADQKSVTDTFNRLVAALFGASYRDPSECAVVSNPLPRHLTPRVLETALGIFVNLNTPDHHRTLMHNFLVNAKALYPGQFYDGGLRQALTHTSAVLRDHSAKTAHIAGNVDILNP